MHRHERICKIHDLTAAWCKIRSCLCIFRKVLRELRIFVFEGFLGARFVGRGLLLGRLLKVLEEAFGGPGPLLEVPGLSWEGFWKSRGPLEDRFGGPGPLSLASLASGGCFLRTRSLYF